MDGGMALGNLNLICNTACCGNTAMCIVLHPQLQMCDSVMCMLTALGPIPGMILQVKYSK